MTSLFRFILPSKTEIFQWFFPTKITGFGRSIFQITNESFYQTKARHGTIKDLFVSGHFPFVPKK